MRDGVPHLRLASIDAFPLRLDLTFPNGEVSSLLLEGALACPADEVQARPAAALAPTIVEPRAAEPRIEAPPAASGSLSEELQRLHRYVASFGGAQRRGDPQGGARIRERIQEKLDAVRPRLEAYGGQDAAELQALFDELEAEAQPASTSSEHPRA
jgi:hypothetical protein